MKTLKLKTTWLKEAEALSDAEMGRLIRGMLKYASSGEEPSIGGNERVMWPKARADVDEQRDSHERQQAGNTTRHNEALCGMMGHDAASRGIEKASPLSPPTPPVITPLKERKKALSKEREKERALSPALQDAIREFRDMRQRMRKPMTEKAVERLLTRLEQLAPGDAGTQVQILQRSIDRGWTDVYQLDAPKRGKERNTLKNYDEYKVAGTGNLQDIDLDLEEL